MSCLFIIFSWNAGYWDFLTNPLNPFENFWNLTLHGRVPHASHYAHSGYYPSFIHTRKHKSLSVWKDGDTVHLYFPTAQLIKMDFYCTVPRQDLVFLHATCDVSPHHVYATPRHCSELWWFLRKPLWSSCPWSLYKHRNLVKYRWKSTLRTWGTSTPRPNTLLPQSNLS